MHGATVHTAARRGVGTPPGTRLQGGILPRTDQPRGSLAHIHLHPQDRLGERCRGPRCRGRHIRCRHRGSDSSGPLHPRGGGGQDARKRTAQCEYRPHERTFGSLRRHRPGDLGSDRCGSHEMEFRGLPSGAGGRPLHPGGPALSDRPGGRTGGGAPSAAVELRSEQGDGPPHSGRAARKAPARTIQHRSQSAGDGHRLQGELGRHTQHAIGQAHPRIGTGGGRTWMRWIRWSIPEP